MNKIGQVNHFGGRRAGKLSRNTFNFLEKSKHEMKIKFHWRALNKPTKWAIKLIVSGKYET